MLPKIKAPIYDVTIPSTKKTIKVRPFEVKEEKILLMARQAGEPSDFFSAIAQIVQNCVLDDKFSALKHPLFDINYIFTKIRAVSISNISKLQFKDAEDEKTYDFEVDLDTVNVKFPEEGTTMFKVSPELSFSMKYPPLSVYTKKEFFDMDEDGVFDLLVVACLDKVYEKDTVHDASESKKEEVLDFINSLPAKHYASLRKFFTDLPHLHHELKYTNTNGKEVVIQLKTIEDFFTFG